MEILCNEPEAKVYFLGCILILDVQVHHLPLPYFIC
nr:MAG TPA: hypothetical protein [Caudoviricetes sp.]